MAIKLVTLKCPECGAMLKVEEGRKQVFCSYCGARILLDNENEYIIHTVDDAEVKHAETERMVELKKMEIAEKNNSDRQKRHYIKIIISIIIGIIAIASFSFDDDSFVGLFACIALLYMWINEISGNNKDEEGNNFSEKVKVPNSISDFEGKKYIIIADIFKNAGFTNVKCVALDDLTIGLISKPDTVKSITINGQNIYSGGKKYYPDSPVVIYYHSFSD